METKATTFVIFQGVYASYEGTAIFAIFPVFYIPTYIGNINNGGEGGIYEYFQDH
jgi:hypothetical protein